MKIIGNNNKNFDCMWNEFLKINKFYNFVYTREYINYKKLRMKKFKDLSFLIIDEKKNVLNLCPLLVNANNSATYENGYNLVPIFSKKNFSHIVERIFFEYLFDSLKKNSIVSWFFEEKIFPDDLVHSQPFTNNNKFMQLSDRFFGYIDLTDTIENIKKKIRKSYKSIINNGLKKYQFEYFDFRNFNDSIGEDYRLFHKKICGRVTRPKQTFYKMYDWIKNGKAILFTQSYNSEILNYTLIVLNKDFAIYASSATARENIDLPLTHSMLWYVIEWCKNMGVKTFEIGDISSKNNIFFSLSDKEANIAFFKKGFANMTLRTKSFAWFKNQTYLKDFVDSSFSDIKFNFVGN